MEFKERKPIYIQIADAMCERILAGTWTEEDRIPSIREMAVEIEVNPNTVTRAYGYLQERNVIRNQRGIGYFVETDAQERTRELKRKDFLENDIPELFRTMSILGIGMEELGKLYEAYSTVGGRS
jgi:DNA-binding transcriptional regulator YhcF (GntR family)